MTAQTASALEKLLPEKIDGWSMSRNQLIVDHYDLYDYIDGGAELYISYNYNSVLTRIYEKPGYPEVSVEIFDMQEAKNAFGVFSHTRYEEDSLFGQGSQYMTGALFFWKNNYYVSIMTPEENTETKDMIFKIASLLDQSILSTGELPGIVGKLPEKNLEKESVLYFFHYIWLNSFYFIANENILFINDTADAVLAKYGTSGHRYYLLLVQYPDNILAGKAYSNFIKLYLPEGKNNRIVELEDHTLCGCKLNEDLFIAVFNAHSETEVNTLLSNF
ncbi:MAG: hypothetical protein JXJ22_07600 [Bacteroidales bacterium]|nr:hypothetical protein [Bacteroidales bacterium]